MLRATTLLLALLLLLAAAGACTAAEQTTGEETADTPTPAATNDDAEIYAVAIREIHALARSSSQVYLVTTTEDLAYGDMPIAPSRKLPAALQAAITAELADETYELIWIVSFDDAPIDPISPQMVEGWHVAEGEGIIITLGNIHPQDDGSAQLSFFMTCADVCGLGTTYVLKQYFGNWHITGTVGPEIAS